MSKFRIGKYNAKLVMAYDDAQRDVPIEGKVGFWVMPWRIIAVFVLLLAILSFFIYRYWRLRKKVKSYQAKEHKEHKK